MRFSKKSNSNQISNFHSKEILFICLQISWLLSPAGTSTRSAVAGENDPFSFHLSFLFHIIFFGPFFVFSEVCSSLMRISEKRFSVVRPQEWSWRRINKIEFEGFHFLFAKKIMIMPYPLYIFVSKILLFGTKIAQPELRIH